MDQACLADQVSIDSRVSPTQVNGTELTRVATLVTSPSLLLYVSPEKGQEKHYFVLERNSHGQINAMP